MRKKQFQLRKVVLLASFAGTIWAQGGGGNGNGALVSLKTIKVPDAPNLGDYVKDRSALIALGKAMFWDVQAGSDGRTACATCHFHAGADHRVQNQLSSPAALSAAIPANSILTLSSFPFRLLSNINDNRSTVVREVRQVAGSAGVVHRNFFGMMSGAAEEDGTDIGGESANSINGIRTRQVTARNTPSVINAVFNVRNFWDGRAQSVFTGATPFGDSDIGLNAILWKDGQLTRTQVRLENSSLASQSVGPALNSTEMSYERRDWPIFARKLLGLTPLGRQKVSTDDSVLGSMSNPTGNGLSAEFGYAALIRASFKPEYWAAPTLENEVPQMEQNFSLFWGLAIQAYESTLVSDDSPLDRFAEGNRQALNATEQQGMQEFLGGGSQCTQCHQGTEFTAASFTNVQRRNANTNNPDDMGFFRTGVSQIAEDIGLGGKDGFDRPLFSGARAGATTGRFKSPGLRNVELTGPYFHDGGQATLEQVMDFYGRNGDFTAGGNLGPGIGQIRLSAQEKTQLVAFIKALTDERVRFERAPFDHPALCVPVGHAASAPGVLQLDNGDPRFSLSALDKWALIPAVGKSGGSVPLQTFEELLKGVGKDGSKAHALNESCEP